MRVMLLAMRCFMLLLTHLAVEVVMFPLHLVPLGAGLRRGSEEEQVQQSDNGKSSAKP